MPIDIGLLKAAARAWKLHDLSDESRSRLEQAGVLDYHKELNDTRVKDFQADSKANAVKFIQINMLMSETNVFID